MRYETHENILIEYIFMWVYVGASQLQDKQHPNKLLGRCWGTSSGTSPPKCWGTVRAPGGHVPNKSRCTCPTSRGPRPQAMVGHGPRLSLGTAPVYRWARFFDKISCPTSCWAQPPSIVGPVPPLLLGPFPFYCWARSPSIVGPAPLPLLGPPPFYCWGHPRGNSPASCWGTARGIFVECYQIHITYNH